MKFRWHKQIKHFFKATAFKVALSALLASCAGVIVLLYFGYYAYPGKLADQTLSATKSGIIEELTNLRDRGDDSAKLPALISALREEKIDELNETLLSERDRQEVGVMKVVDRNGFVLTRTRSSKNVGDNAFVASPLGRKMIQTNQGSTSIELSSVDDRQLIFSTGRFVYDNDLRVGALFASAYVDDDFASRFAKMYLPENAQVAFYTKQYGLVGTSITSEPQKTILSSYVVPQLDFIQKDNARTLIRLPGYKLVVAQNIIFPGLEESPGGVLIFTPAIYFWPAVVSGFLIPILVFFISLIFIKYYEKKKKVHSIWCCPALFFFVVFYVVSYIAIFLMIFNSLTNFKITPYPLYNSVLRFQPEGGIFDHRFSQKVSVILDSGGESINAVRLSIAYDPKVLRIQSIDMDKSICKHFILSEHNSLEGKIEMECIIPNPGFKGNSATVADLFVKPEEEIVTTSLKFLDDCRVLANDGLGTDVLRMAVNTNLRFTTMTDFSNQEFLSVFSPSHPNPERWYSKKTITLSWAPSLPGALIDDQSKENLPPLYKKVTSDGVYKFKVSATNNAGKQIFGELVAQVDTTAPEKLELSASETKIKPGGLVRFTASGSDSLSGLQKVFYLKIDNEIFFPIGSEIYIPFPQAGVYNVTLRAYDKAGNYRDVTKTITVKRYQ